VKESYFHQRGEKHQFTLCGLVTEDGDLNIGVAMCSTREQNFVKATGRSIAKARAQQKPYDVVPDFELHHGNMEMVKAINLHLQQTTQRIQENPTAIREITQLYHKNRVKKVKPAPRFTMVEEKLAF